MGNPNVGKSVVFSRLTGVHVIASNYPGTTVGYTSGFMKLGEEQAEVIDVPGTYTLEPTSEAEEIALKMLKTGDVVINVVDATNLERNLNLTLQLLEAGISMVVSTTAVREYGSVLITVTKYPSCGAPDLSIWSTCVAKYLSTMAEPISSTLWNLSTMCSCTASTLHPQISSWGWFCRSTFQT